MTGLRPERAVDAGAIAAVLNAAFANGGEPVAEAALVDQLRRDGDLDLSLVAVGDDSRIVGHAALSPLAATFPALALAPVAVEPGHQGRGIGSALVRAALATRPGHTVVVLGEPRFYSRFGFRPVGWDCPYAGPFLQATGPHMPDHARIAYAPAFAALG